MPTISDGLTTFTPLLISGYETEVEGRNVLHAILDRPDVDVTLREAGLRTGSLVIVCSDEPQAAECLAMHRRPARFTLTRENLPGASMTYVIAEGRRIRVTLDKETLVPCVVEVEYQEVLP